MNIPKIIAHRGASFYAPENTLAALKKAHALGVRWVEFDVQLTRDHVPIVFHDGNLKRITAYNKMVAATPFEKIKTLNAGKWFSKNYQNERIPTLYEWLESAAHLGMGINLELKAETNESIDILVDQVILALRTCWFDHLPPPIISSFSMQCLDVMAKRNSGYSLAFLIERWSKNVFNILDQYQCVSLHTHHSCLTPKRIQTIHASNRKVLAYTIDDLKLANYFWNIGVDAVFSNNLLLQQYETSLS